MKRIIGIFLVIFLTIPAFCLACPLCTPIPGKTGDTPDCYIRHVDRECDYYFTNVGGTFISLMKGAINEWLAYASISMTESGSGWGITYIYNETPCAS